MPGQADAARAGSARRATRLIAESVVGVPLLAAVIVTADRVGETARFVTWPILAFTSLAAAVALVGLRFGLDRPWLLAAGVLPALVLSYVLPAAPIAIVAVVLVGLGVLAVVARGLAAGTALAVGAVMALLVVIQGPAVECGESDTVLSSPWWIASSPHSSGDSTGTPDGRISGTIRVGSHRYSYACADGGLTRFEGIRP